MPVALAGAALGARDDPDSWRQIVFDRDRLDLARDTLIRAKNLRMPSGRMSVEEAQRIIKAAPVPDARQFTMATEWEECCDHQFCAYAADVRDSPYMDEASIDLYRRNLDDPDGEGWAEIMSSGGSWSSYMPDPSEMSDHEVLDLAEERGAISAQERLALEEKEEGALDDFVEDYRSNFEFTDSDFAAAAESMAEGILDDAWQFDPACD